MTTPMTYQIDQKEGGRGVLSGEIAMEFPPSQIRSRLAQPKKTFQPFTAARIFGVPAMEDLTSSLVMTSIKAWTIRSSVSDARASGTG